MPRGCVNAVREQTEDGWWIDGQRERVIHREMEAKRQCDRDFSRAFVVSIGTLREYLF